MNLYEQKAEADGRYAIALGLFAVARAIDRLGTGNAATDMGAIEFLAVRLSEEIRRSRESISEKLEDVTAAVNSIPE